MNEQAEERKFIIAYDPLHPQQSKILTGEIIGSSDDAYAGIDISPFVGQGMMLCESRIIDSLESAQDHCCELVVDGKPAIFETNKILDFFPVIEGELAPGIYQFYQHDTEYYEIKDGVALSRFFIEDPNFGYEEEKFVCRPDGISLYDIKTDEELNFYKRHPFSFFDVHCPLCRQQIMGYHLGDYGFECEVSLSPCLHYIGKTVLQQSSYESERLDNLGINYKFIDGDIYFETARGWQKPVIFMPPDQPLDSIWNGTPSLKYGLADHFFFVESER